jgi:hypothetical protein
MKAEPLMTDAERMAIEDSTGKRLPVGLPRPPAPQISADAKFIASKIVTHMWIIFVALPFVIYLLISMLK